MAAATADKCLVKPAALLGSPLWAPANEALVGVLLLLAGFAAPLERQEVISECRHGQIGRPLAAVAAEAVPLAAAPYARAISIWRPPSYNNHRLWTTTARSQ